MFTLVNYLYIDCLMSWLVYPHVTLGSFIRGKIRREVYHLYEHVSSKTRTARINGSRLRTGVKGCSKIRRLLAKPHVILDEMCLLYGKFASYLRTRRIFPRINGPIVSSSHGRFHVGFDLLEPLLFTGCRFELLQCNLS